MSRALTLVAALVFAACGPDFEGEETEAPTTSQPTRFFNVPDNQVLSGLNARQPSTVVDLNKALTLPARLTAVYVEIGGCIPAGASTADSIDFGTVGPKHSLRVDSRCFQYATTAAWLPTTNGNVWLALQNQDIQPPSFSLRLRVLGWETN